MRTKDQLIQSLSKHYRSGYYWLVFTGDNWGICEQQPQFNPVMCEKYFVHSAFINQLAKVEEISE